MTRYISAYAGIGSRNISIQEHLDIAKVANMLSKMNFLLYSGNASGSDQAFQKASNGKCIVFLPREGFEIQSFNYKTEAVKYFVRGNSPEGLASIPKYHDKPQALDKYGREYMARNYHQIHGEPPILPMVRFVVCCADPKHHEKYGEIVEGGTGQAVKIAKDNKIPVVNIRKEGWNRYLKDICTEIIKNR